MGRNAAVLNYTRFAYMDQATIRRINNAATPKPGAFDTEFTELSLPDFDQRETVVNSGRDVADENLPGTLRL